MVHDHIENDPHPAPVDFLDQLQRVVHRPVFGGDRLIVGDIISKVRLRRSEEGRAPNGFESQLVDVIQFLEDALQVTDAIPIAVVKRARINLIDRGFVIPGCCHVVKLSDQIQKAIPKFADVHEPGTVLIRRHERHV